MKRFLYNYAFVLLSLLLFSGALFAEIKIDRIHFVNNKHFSSGDLRDIIHSERGRDFEPRIMRLDRILLGNFYRQHGFLNIEISDSVSSLAKRDRVTITYFINEGQRFYYGGIRMQGNEYIDSTAITASFKELKPLSPFNEVSVNEALQNVENLYYNSGKPFVELVLTYSFEEDSLVVLQLNVKENQTVFVKDVQYFGLRLVQKFLIRRELEIRQGDKYNRRAIEKSQENMYGTGLFRYVRLEIEPIENEPGQVILKILVQEREPAWVGLRLGLAHEQQAYYGSKVEFTAQGGHRNLFGTARSLSLQVTPSLTYDFDEDKLHNLDNKIALMFVEPWIGNTRTPGTFRVSYEQYRPLYSGNFDLIAASFDLQRKFGDHIQLNSAIAAKRVDQLSDEAIDSTLVINLDVRKSQIYSLTFYGKKDTRKNLFNPSNSSYTDLSIGFAYSTGRDQDKINTTNQYITVIGSWQRYQPYRPKVLHFRRWNFTLASRLKMGAIFEMGKKQSIPINDLFFAGGASSVRGYQEQLLGPASVLDEQGRIRQAAGGKLIYLGNIEVRMPIYWIFVLTTFFDSGYVWPEVSAFRPMDVKMTTGLGLAAITPLGPIRMDYGYKLIRTDRDPSAGALHFGIYFAF